MSTADELSIKLTAKDEISAKLKGVRAELKDAQRAVIAARKEMENTGSPQAAAEYDRLTRSMEDLYKAQKKLTDAQRANNRALKDAERQIGLNGSAWAKLGRGVEQHAKTIQRSGLVMGAAMALFAKSSISAFAEAEKQQASLSQAMAKFPKINDVTRASFDGLNTSLMNLTGADDDALASAEAMLARFDLTGKQIQQLIPLVNDYAILMGEDVVDASSSIGKAMLGNAKALKDMGINFKATGDRGRDLATIMGLLEQKAGGAGAAFGPTTAGQLAIANENFENLKETVGEALVPALKTAVGVMKPVVGFLTAMPGPAKQVSMVFGAVGVAAMIATPRILSMVASLKLMGVSGGGVAGRLKGIAGAVAGPLTGALVGGMVILALWQDKTQRMADAMARFQGTVDATTGALNKAGLQQVFEDLMGSVRDSTWQTLAKVGVTMNGVADSIAKGGPAYDALKGRLRDLIKTGGETSAAAMSLGAWLGEIVPPIDNVRKATALTDRAMAAAGTSAQNYAGDLGNVTYFTSTATAKTLGLARALNQVVGILDRDDAVKAYGKSINEYLKKPSIDAAKATTRAFVSAAGAFKDGSKAQAAFVNRNLPAVESAIRGSGMDKDLRRKLLSPLREAQRAAIRVQELIDLIHGKRIAITYTGGTPTNPGGYHKALGGAVFGPGTGTSDSIPAMLSNGEYVIRAAAARTIGYDQLNKLNLADRTPVLPPMVNAPPITLPAGSGGPAVQNFTANITTTGQVDLELALAREARRMERDRRTRYAGTRP